EDPVIMPRTSEGLYLLQRVRVEAHRFAMTHHSQRRSKSMIHNVLDPVPGLGKTRRRARMNHLVSVKTLRAATVKEIAVVPGIGPATAQSIVSALHEGEPSTPAVNMTTGEILED